MASSSSSASSTSAFGPYRDLSPVSLADVAELMSQHPTGYRRDVFTVQDPSSLIQPLLLCEPPREVCPIPLVSAPQLQVEPIPYSRQVDEFQKKEFKRLKAMAYVDYGGAGQPMKTVVERTSTYLSNEVLGNTHSENPSAQRSSDLTRRARDSVRRFFATSDTEHEVIFTSGTSAALRLLADAYFNSIKAAGVRGTLLLTDDCHNAVNGMRTVAQEKGLEHLVNIVFIPLDIVTLRIDEEHYKAAIQALNPGERGLVLLTAQSNVTGVKHPFQRLLQMAKRHGWDTALDAAAYVPTSPLDLGAHPEIDFLPCSWYKVLGYPTGIGSLLVRTDAMPKLRKDHFSGGTVTFVHNGRVDQFQLADGASRFEDGTLNFQSFLPLEMGLNRLLDLGPSFRKAMSINIRALTTWMIQHLPQICWPETGHPVVRIIAFPSTSIESEHGGTISLVFYDAKGVKLPLAVVEREAIKHKIHLRSGCMCNYVARLGSPGNDTFCPEAGPDAISLVEWKFDVLKRNWVLCRKPQHGPFEEAGVVRISLGIGSRKSDVRAIYRFVKAYAEGNAACA